MDLVKQVVAEMLRGSDSLAIDVETGILELPRHELDEFTGGISLERILGTEEDVLGHYTPMSSPGSIARHSGNLRAFLWHLVDTLRNRRGLPVIKEDLPAMAQLLASSTYHHEHFHFFCDIRRKLFPVSKYDRLTEEALAVAYKHRRIHEEHSRWQSVVGRMTRIVYRSLLVETFKYTQPGYRDWILYSDDARFADGLANYIDPPNRQFLEASGVAVDSLLMAQLDRVYGFRVLENTT